MMKTWKRWEGKLLRMTVWSRKIWMFIFVFAFKPLVIATFIVLLFKADKIASGRFYKEISTCW